MEREVSKISIEGGELIMSVAERMHQESLEEGALKKARETAKNLLELGDYSVTKIAMVTGLEEKEIREIEKEIEKEMKN